jgi:hypothetical protein
MSRRESRPEASRECVLRAQREQCSSCGKLMRVTYHNRRTVCTLQGLCRLTVVIRCCQNQACERCHLEQCFGSVRWHKRRATGRKTVPGLVVRGPVRVLAAVASHSQYFCVQALQLHDTQAWDHLRDQLEARHEQHRLQFRFRKDPQAYLAATEDILIQTALSS